jgi:glycosyltransferase involved in cell wall biosynthesis
VDGVLVMVGEGPSLRGARQLAESLGVLGRVRFLGNQMDIPNLMGCGDVFLFPSETESFGLAPLEAMASEMPVVATDAGGIPEVVVHGETGFLAAVGDVEKMAEHAIALGLSADLRAEMGAAGRLRAEREFPATKAADQYEAVYHEVVGR